MKTEKVSKNIILLFIGILFIQTLSSQENFLPSYVIKLNGDTLEGFIDYRNWEYNPKSIIFKAQNDSKAIVFSPMDLIEFRVHNEIYVSGIVNSEISPLETSKLTRDPVLKLSIDTTFLQVIFQGDKSLYFLKNSVGRQNFYIKQNGNFELLIYKKYLKEQNGRDVIIVNKKYIGQLVFYFSGCPTIQSQIMSVNYNWKNLENIFQLYYKSSESEIVYQKKIEKVVAELGLLTGVSLTNLRFTGGENLEYLTEGNFNNSLNLTTGIYLDIILPRNRGRWSINNELVLNSYKSTGHYLDYEHENRYSNTTSTIEYTYLKLNNLLRYRYPIKNINLFFNVGISNGIAITVTNSKVKKTIFYTTITDVETEAVVNARKHEQGIIIGTGLKYKKFSIEFRYEKGNGMSVLPKLSSATNRYSLLLGYNF